MNVGITKPYRPQQGSVAWRVIEFFATNPEERLTPDDIAAKFDVPSKQVHSILGLAVESGALQRIADDDEDELVYRLGKGVPAIVPNPAAHPTLKGAGIANAITPKPEPVLLIRRGQKELAEIDLSACKVEDGVPIPPKKTRETLGKRLVRMIAVLQPGQSILFPEIVSRNINAALSELKKQQPDQLYTRRVEGTGMRVWREK
jgi:hypothetical protein